ncbi:hypothetical protein [Sphingobacterium sp. Mn56C]|uniref:hypothetical protein n=1 Tax=Sphingobacterium sp. Mn56C TaxID=3395261 RepID=UPI003BF5CEB7
MTTKNHTISKIVAKSFVRLLLLVLAFSVYLYFGKKDLASASLYFPNPWTLAFPFLLFVLVVVLLILTLRKKYQETDINWLFSLSAIFFIAYIVLLYSRIYPAI